MTCDFFLFFNTFLEKTSLLKNPGFFNLKIRFLKKTSKPKKPPHCTGAAHQLIKRGKGAVLRHKFQNWITSSNPVGGCPLCNMIKQSQSTQVFCEAQASLRRMWTRSVPLG